MHNKRNIHILCAVALLQGMVFYAPVASLYRQAAGLNLAQIALIEGISYLLCIMMELPWGMLADAIGCRRTMVLCGGFYFLSKIIFWRAEGFAAFLLERFVLSIAIAGLSGVEESMLYLSAGDACSHRAFSRHEACSRLGLLLASGAYALCIGKDYRLAALMTVAAYGLALLLTLFLHEVQPADEKQRFSLKQAAAMMGETLKDRRLMLFLLGFALFQEAAQAAGVWLNQNQYLRCGMDERAIALAYIIVSCLSLGGAFSHRFSKKLGNGRFSALVLLAAACACVLLACTRSALLSVASVAVVSACSALLSPLFARICNRRADGSGRATRLSIYAALQSCAAAGSSALCGRIADISLAAALLLCGAMCLACLPAFGQMLREK